MTEKNVHFSTQAAHRGDSPSPPPHPLVEPLYSSSSYRYRTLEEYMEAASALAMGQPRFFYTRLGNPTNALFEEKIALLEGAAGAVATASGMSAIALSILSLVRPGERVLAHHRLYSATDLLFDEYLPGLGIRVDRTDLTQTEKLRQALQTPTRIVFAEVPASPLLEMIDIAACAEQVHQAGALLIVDNTLASPALLQPLLLGADLVAASASKYLGGHGDAMAGYVAGAREWVAAIANWSFVLGPTLSPMNASALLKGMRTLQLRMERHCANALAVARFLEGHSKIQRVAYPGLSSYPAYTLARKQMKGAGGMISCWLKGAMENVFRLLAHLQLCYVSVGLGDVVTLLEHPATMSYVSLPRERRKSLEIGDTLIRLSVGIEDERDLIRDLDQALLHA